MTRRRAAGRPRGTGVEEAVVAAVIEELVEHGAGGLRVSRVASAAGVNKTSVYRRWKTREELIAAALRAVTGDITGQLMDTGSLRGDLGHLVAVLGSEVASKRGRALVRVALSNVVSPSEVVGLGPPSAMPGREGAEALVTRAAQRGEWDVVRHPPEPIFSMLTGAVIHRVQIEGQSVSEEWTATIVDLVARGVAPDAGD